ncbi:MAG: hypothetical protein E7159_02135 [Firmicutes bacterium]|nr:hypothetical protein [Bacillota bacterium]
MKYDFEKEIIEQKPLTAKQKNILDYIKKYIAEYNYAPTIREIGEGNNLSSSATVHTYINILITKGWLKKSDYKFRTLEVVGENEYLNQARGITTLPLINEDKDFKEQQENGKKIDIYNDQFAVTKESLVIKITKDDIFQKDDYIITKPSSKYKDSDYVVTLKDDKVSIVKYKANTKNIIGKVIASIRKY